MNIRLVLLVISMSLLYPQTLNHNENSLLYFELGGIGGIGSLNAELHINKSISFRFGLGIKRIASLPVAISYKKGSNHSLVISTGFTWNIFHSIGDEIYITTLIGYRLQPINKKFMFQIGICSLKKDIGTLTIWPHIGIGTRI